MSQPSYINGVDPLALHEFEDEGYSDESALALAQGLLEEAAPHLERVYPELPATKQKIVKYAVLSMAKYLKNEWEEFDRATSAFQSESIASYSYNKMAQNIRDRAGTGVEAFDRAVSMLSAYADNSEGAVFGTKSEAVFEPGYQGYVYDREGRNNGPFNPWGTDRSWPIHDWGGW